MPISFTVLHQCIAQDEGFALLRVSADGLPSSDSLNVICTSLSFAFVSVYCTRCVVFAPQPLRLWCIVITRGRQAVRNSALTKKLTDEFCFFFTDMTYRYVPGQFIPYIFFCGHFPRWPSKKLVGTITYESLFGLHSNLVWLFYRYF